MSGGRINEILPHEVELPQPREAGFLGNGAFGSVYRGRCRGADVAVKVLGGSDLDEAQVSPFGPRLLSARFSDSFFDPFFERWPTL
jgi:hypothetical protein